MVIKANQPETLGAIAELFANPVWLPGEQGSNALEVRKLRPRLTTGGRRGS